MEVQTVEDASVSLADVATYGGIAVLLVSLVFLPTAFDSTYPRLVNTLLLVLLLGLKGRVVVVSYMVFLQDWRDGFSHHPLEYLAAFTTWFYLAFQSIVFVAAFIEEFVLDQESVYVTTSRSEDADRGASDAGGD